MTCEDPLNLFLALTTICAVKFVGTAFCRRKKLSTFEYVGNISALNFHPVKSCGPIKLQTVKCTKHGFCYRGYFDRHWMVVANNGMRVNIQQEPKMTLIQPSICDNKLCLNAPGMSTLELDKDPHVDSSEFIDCKVHGVSILGMKCGKVASDWICKYLGKDGLYIVVSTPNMTKRDISEMKTKPWLNPPTIDDKVTFSEVGVCNIACESSLSDLNNRLDNPVVMGNFRPSIVVSGSTAFDEDFWIEIKIGENVYMRVLEPNPRCLLITVDPKGRRDAQTEPLRTLRKFRKSPLYGDSPLFGLTTAVDFEGVIKVGDPVHVLRKI